MDLKNSQSARFWIIVSAVVSIAATLPLIWPFFCQPVAVDDRFYVDANRQICQGGVIVSFLLLLLVAAISVIFRGKVNRFQDIAVETLPQALPRLMRPAFVASVFAMIVIAIFGVYLFQFTFSAEAALLSADQDVTNVSTAIAHTSFGDLLPSPYVNAGSSRSFLAHHFSPTLFLYVPAFKMAMAVSQTVDHNFYNSMLAVTILSGIGLWLYYGYRMLGDMRILLPLVLIPILHNFLLFRQILSFHFETLSLPLLALLLLSIRLHGRTNLPLRAEWLRRSYLLIAVLYLGIKEDMGIYLGIFAGVYFLFEVIEEARKANQSFLNTVIDVVRRSLYFRLGLLAVVWLLFAMLARQLIAGDGAMDWQSYWDVASFKAKYPQFRKTPYTYLWVVLSTGIWIFFSLRSLLIVGAILMFHIVSGMPWHALLESHYSYTVLPFLYLGSIRGALNLLNLAKKGKMSQATLLVLLFAGAGVADYSLRRDGNHPYSMFQKHRGYDQIRESLPLIEDDACVQSSFHLSALVPLRARPIPFTFYEKSPYRKTMPGAAQLHLYNPSEAECKSVYRLWFGSASGVIQDENDRYGKVIAIEPGLFLLWKMNDSTGR
mgnify:CR=1 FL=1